MGARVEQLSEILGLRSETEETQLKYQSHLLAGFEFWVGATGTSYVHSVYPLLNCPELPSANFVLVRRSADGEKAVRHVGQTTHTCPSLNRAHIRQLAAELDANEVHVHFLGTSSRSRSVVAFDIEAGSVTTDAPVMN